MNTDSEHSPSKVLVIGGRHVQGLKGGGIYGEARILELDITDGTVEVVFKYVSDRAITALDGETAVFKAASILGDKLFLPMHTEVVIVQIGSYKHIGSVTHEAFNDLHHVIPGRKESSLIVVSTGLDAALEVDYSGILLTEWSALDKSVWDRFDSDVDYRQILSTQPHQSHPNYCFFAHGELWLTRFHQSDAICLTSTCAPFLVGDSKIHDGVISEGDLYFTMVTGSVVRFSGCDPTQRREFDLNLLDPSGLNLGWCRSVLPMGNARCLVGFSRMRPTSRVGNLKGFVRRKLGLQSRPSRVSLYSLATLTLLKEFELEDAGLDGIFAILPLP